MRAVDPEDANPSSSEKKAKIVNQRDRQMHALMLSRQGASFRRVPLGFGTDAFLQLLHSSSVLA